MKLEEAAAILGVSSDADLDLLKQTYKKLALAWHPDKCTDPKAKEKFQQISIAYTKIVSSRCDCGNADSDDDFDDAVYEEDVNEMRVFMRMFMDLVGIFNDDDDVVQNNEKLPGVSFGMMFGAPHGCEDWSSEEEECDDYDSDNAEENETIWEPMVKHYFHMNLKEEASKERESADKDDSEAKRKQRNAKKRAEKRRKQKEKRVREAAVKAEEDEKARLLEEEAKREHEEKLLKKREEARRIQEEEDAKRNELFSLVAQGKHSEVISRLEVPYAPGGVRATDRKASGGKSGDGLLHACVVKSDSRDASEGKLKIAKYLLALRSPALDLGLVNEGGCAVMHVAASCDDVSMMTVLLEHNRNEETSKKHLPVDINIRCMNLGFTPLHYAAGNASTRCCKLLLKYGALLNIHGYNTGKNSSDTKGPTPLEYCRQRFSSLRKSLSASKQDKYKSVISMLEDAVKQLENARLRRESDKSKKDSKHDAERMRRLEKEQTEKELLERKQRQLRERQEKMKEEEEARTAALLEEKTSSKSKKKKKKDKKKSGDDVSHSNTQSDTKSSNRSDTSKSSHTASEVVTAALHNGPSGSGATSQAPKSSSSVAPAQLGAEVTSRDELVDHLLAMGFPESDCLQAIKVCGLNVDRAISWLVERPAPESTQETPSVPTPASSSSTSTQPKTSQAQPKAPAQTSPKTSTINANTPDCDLTPAQKAQKDKDLKEELRRINREWNAKVPHQRAEEEKKKAEADRVQRELDRQRALQQQLQAQYSMHSMFNVAPPISYSQQPMPGMNSGSMSQQPIQQTASVPALSSNAFPMMPSQASASTQQPQLGVPQQQPLQHGVTGIPGQPTQQQNTSYPPPNATMSQNYPPLPSHPSPPQSTLSNIPPGLSLPTSDNSANGLQQPNVGLTGAGGSVMNGPSYATNLSPNAPDRVISAKSSPAVVHQPPPHIHESPISSHLQNDAPSQVGGQNQPFSLDMPYPPGLEYNEKQSGGVGDGGIFGNEREMNLADVDAVSKEEYIDGVVNLSAIARPFIPKFTSSPSMSPPQFPTSAQVNPSTESLSLPPLGAQTFSQNTEWKSESNINGGDNSSSGTSFLWNQTSKGFGDNESGVNDTDANFDMMAMLGNFDDLLQPDTSDSDEHHGSLLHGLVSGGRHDGRQSTSSRFLNLGDDSQNNASASQNSDDGISHGFLSSMSEYHSTNDDFLSSNIFGDSNR